MMKSPLLCGWCESERVPFRPSPFSSSPSLGLRRQVTLVLPGYVKTSLSVNAVTGSGASYAKMDATTAQGMEPADLARAILEAVATGENEVLACDLKTKLAILARALIPDTLAKYMASRAKKGWKELRKP